MKSDKNFFPAEWHSQSGVQLSWPHKNSDWAPYLDEAEECFVNIAAEISKREKVLIVCPKASSVIDTLAGRANADNLRFVEMATNDTWARDHGAITVFHDGLPVLLDFSFNGWGLKFVSNLDNRITRNVFDAGVFSETVSYGNRLNTVLEGGSVESDGAGTILTTSECLMSPNRNGEWSRSQIEDYLQKVFFAKQILWLDHGYLSGDDTDSHIDTLARICPNDTITYVKCTDTNDEHYNELALMEKELENLKTLSGKHFCLVPLPMADAVYYDGERLPATYANFLIINGAVLVPAYNQPENDRRACEVLTSVFKDREVISIDCSVLIRQHGSLHCVTMQFPEGVIK